MMIQFSILFTISILHDYTDGQCQDFSFILPADTVQLLKNGKLITKVREGKLYVLFEADATNTALVSMAGKTLRIGLKLLNPFFSHITDFDFDSSTPLYQNYSDDFSQLDGVKKATLVGAIINHSLTTTTRPVMVTLKNTDGQILQTDTITMVNNRSMLSYDLTGQAVGTYLIKETYPDNTETIAYYYVDAELQRQGIFGVIEIMIDPSFYTTAPEFEIAFEAKKERLKYYIVAKNYTNAEEANQLFNQLTVLDQSASEIAFTKVVADEFTSDEISPSLLGYVVLFKSRERVKRQEEARKKIQLHKNNEVLIAHLPQPSIGKITADFIVQLSKP